MRRGRAASEEQPTLPGLEAGGYRAPSARAELTDASMALRFKDDASSGCSEKFDAWPPVGSDVVVRVPGSSLADGYWIAGVMGVKQPGPNGETLRRVSLRPERMEGLSDSLKASLPKVVEISTLKELRRP